jgi:hypothetical protein
MPRKNEGPGNPGAFIVVVLERAWSNLARLGEPAPDADRDATPAMPARNRRVRMTLALAQEIERRYRAGETSRAVADALGVSKSTALKALRTRQVAVRPIGIRY